MREVHEILQPCPLLGEPLQFLHDQGLYCIQYSQEFANVEQTVSQVAALVVRNQLTSKVLLCQHMQYWHR